MAMTVLFLEVAVVGGFLILMMLSVWYYLMQVYTMVQSVHQRTKRIEGILVAAQKRAEVRESMVAVPSHWIGYQSSEAERAKLRN